MPHRHVMFLFALIAALISHSSTWAQSGGGAGRSEPTRDRLNLDFAGGTVVQYINAIREILPDANFVVMPGAEEFQIPEMQLRHITLEHLAMLINHVAMAPDEGGRITVGDLRGVYTIIVQRPSKVVMPAEPKTEQMVLSLEEVIQDDIKAEDVLTSIETALALFGDDFPAAQVRYHDATKLLIARGHQLQVIHIMTVVDQLRDARKAQDMAAQLEVLTAEQRQYQELLAAREQQMMSLNHERDELRRRLQQLERELEDCKKRTVH